MRYLIDSNLWLYAASGKPQAVQLLDKAAKAEWAGYSAITRLEIFGFPGLGPSDEAKLRGMLTCFAEVDVDGPVIDRAIEVRRKRRIKAPDAILAATALLMGATLATRNTQDFRGIPGLAVEDPFAEGGEE